MGAQRAQSLSSGIKIGEKNGFSSALDIWDSIRQPQTAKIQGFNRVK
jgi:hypothetical protein